MTDNIHRKNRSWAWLLALVGITTASVVVYFTTYFIDSSGNPDVSLGKLLLSKGARNAMSNMPEVIAGVLGITITVVAIIVELAANRYTPRVTDLFVKSTTNLLVLGFFVMSGLMCVWVSLTSDSPGFIPRVGTAVTIFTSTACMLILLPYFAFVFSFLDPRNVIEHMGRSAFKAVNGGSKDDERARRRAKLNAVRGIEQLADVALNAIEHKDKGICMHSVDTLGKLVRDYLKVKSRMHKGWFIVDQHLRDNPDFVSMQEDVLLEIEDNRYWFEMKVLRQYQMLYGETLNRMRDINYLIAINTRKFAEQAMRDNDNQTVELAVKFFNTFLRATINGRDIRTAYNVLNQYRLLAENAMRIEQYEVAYEIVERFKYYGQLGFGMGLPFVLETAAYDLCALNELAFDQDVPVRDKMLAVFLEVDKEAEEDHEFEASLRGVRKAQVKLATHYLINGAEDLARSIFEDMRGEKAGRLTSIHSELKGITSRDFWEVSDRGVNFDYLEPERREMLEVFFGWFLIDGKDGTTNPSFD
jgi:Predicted membrane protein (DUF2254)